MAKQVFDSPDLVRMIYSFGDPDHRKFTQKLKVYLPSHAQLWDDCFQRNRTLYENINDYFRRCSKRQLKRQLRNYKRCFCCTRHSIDMPILVNKKVVNTGPSVFEHNPDGEPNKCACPCRSLSRNIIDFLSKNYEDTYGWRQIDE
jgi:hypothetical protein